MSTAWLTTSTPRRSGAPFKFACTLTYYNFAADWRRSSVERHPRQQLLWRDLHLHFDLLTQIRTQAFVRELGMFMAPEQAPRKDTRPLGLVSPEPLVSQSWYVVCASAIRRPTDIPEERMNMVQEQRNDVDERGMHEPIVSPAGRFLPIALASWNRKTQRSGPRSPAGFCSMACEPSHADY